MTAIFVSTRTSIAVIFEIYAAYSTTTHYCKKSDNGLKVVAHCWACRGSVVEVSPIDTRLVYGPSGVNQAARRAESTIAVVPWMHWS